MEMVVFSLSDSGGVVQLEGTVGRQLRKSFLTSGGMSVPEIVASGVEEWCYETSIFISFLDYWQVTLTWSPYGDASLIQSFTYW